jgi:hypothetical protein
MDEGSMYLVFVEPATNSETSPRTAGGKEPTPTTPAVDHKPIANPDAVTVTAGTTTTVAVLDNDSGLEDGPVTVTITAGLANGTASITSDNQVAISIDQGYSGNDAFTYKVTDMDGDSAVSSVSVTVTCTSCATPQQVSISWLPSPEPVDGYEVFFGTTRLDTPVMIGKTTGTSMALSADQLPARKGQDICFRLRAYNAAGVSPLSEAACEIL